MTNFLGAGPWARRVRRQEKALVKCLCCAQQPPLRKTRRFGLESREVITDGGPPGGGHGAVGNMGKGS